MKAALVVQENKMADKIANTMKQYDIKIDYLVPTIVTYKVTAENEHEA